MRHRNTWKPERHFERARDDLGYHCTNSGLNVFIPVVASILGTSDTEAAVLYLYY